MPSGYEPDVLQIFGLLRYALRILFCNIGFKCKIVNVFIDHIEKFVENSVTPRWPKLDHRCIHECHVPDFEGAWSFADFDDFSSNLLCSVYERLEEKVGIALSEGFTNRVIGVVHDQLVVFRSKLVFNREVELKWHFLSIDSNYFNTNFSMWNVSRENKSKVSQWVLPRIRLDVAIWTGSCFQWRTTFYSPITKIIFRLDAEYKYSN